MKDIPKVELHLHLDGSVRLETASKLLNKSIDELKKEMIADSKCLNLNDYLTKFSLPCEIMQTKENLELISFELAKSLKEENVIYAEIRFAPIKHMLKGLTGTEVIESILNGLKKIDIKTNLILCMMRGDSFENNLEVINLAKKFLNKGVVGLDLAGAESLFKTSDYQALFKKANLLNIPFTIHAGEAAGKDSMNCAIEFGAKRIGHGVYAIRDSEIIKKLKDKNILLEVCPMSNIQTNICDSYSSHPIKNLYDLGISLSINTDNRTVSNISLTEEYQNLEKYLGFNKKDFYKMNIDAVKHSFLPENEKEELLKYFNI